MDINEALILENEDIYEKIKEENKLDAQKLYKDSCLLKETMSEINDLLEKSGEKINYTDDIISKSKEDIEITEKNISEANKYSHKKNLIKTTVISSIIGLCLGGPIGGGICSAIGTGITLGIFSGSILGTLGFGSISYNIMKKKIN